MVYLMLFLMKRVLGSSGGRFTNRELGGDDAGCAEVAEF